jgi:D-alanyl-D-alanine carboxypeptidase
VGERRSLVRLTAACAGLLVVCVACSATTDTRSAGATVESGSSIAAAVATPAAIAPSAGHAPAVPVDLIPFREPSTAPLPAETRLALQSVLNDVMTQASSLGIAGVTAAAVTRDGAWAGAAGADGQGNGLVPESMMSVASITKTVVAAEVLNLAETGRVELDAPASTYLHHPLLARGPTVRQLLSHTSGVGDDTTNKGPDEIAAGGPDRTWTADEVLAFVNEPPSEPGQLVLDYNNFNYLLLGLLIEQVTGKPLAASLRADVLGSIGPRIVVQDTERPPEPLAMPGQRNDGVHRGSVPSDGVYLPSRAWATAVGGAGCIASDAPTLAAWGYRLYGGYVLPVDRVAEMTTPIAGDYGLGTAVFTGNRGANTDSPVGHSGSTPGYSSEMGVDPHRQISVAVLFVGNADQGVDQALANLLAVLQK